MNRDQDVERLVERWLKDDAPPIPGRVREAVHDEVARTQQASIPGSQVTFERRWNRALGPVELVAAATLLVLIVAGGLTALGRLPNLMPGVLGPSLPTTTATQASMSPTASTSPIEPSAMPGPFSGTWSTLDEDGSQMTVTFEGTGSARRIRITDMRGTICAGDRYLWDGTGAIDGAVIGFVGLGGCEGRPMDVPFSTTYTHDASSDTLRSPVDFADAADYVWVRGAVPLDAFRGRWVATDIDGTALELILEGAGALDRHVVYHDDHAQFCTQDPGYTAEGQGTIGSVLGDGRFLRVSLVGACDDGASPREWDHKYEFDWATGTLIGPLVPLEIGGTRGVEAVVWTRP